MPRSVLDLVRFDLNPPIPLMRQMMREYAEQLGIDLRFQNFEAELAQLPGRYAPPAGCLSVAYVREEPAGCGAFRGLDAGVCEMKRLYLRPAFRGRGLGRAIARMLIAQAQLAGHRTMRLDTLSTMHPAIALYKSLGFRRIPAYYQGVADCVYFELTLSELL